MQYFSCFYLGSMIFVLTNFLSNKAEEVFALIALLDKLNVSS